jgi:uncharacterized protein YyaL (SSP411 family)
MLTAGLIGEAPPVQVTIAGPADDATKTAMIAAARSPRALGLALAVLESADDGRRLAAEAPFAAQAAGVDDRPRAWVCVNRSCRDPVDTAKALAAVLDAVAAT